MKTRKQYMDNDCTHREYYGQFVDDKVLGTVARHITIERIKTSTDAHFNDIPLKKWDCAGAFFNTSALGQKMRDCGDWVTMAGLVCIGKEAARQLGEMVKA